MGEQRGTRVYVGNLTDKIKKDDLEGEFTKYGKLNSVWIAFNPPGFAFVEFEHRDDAEKACDVLNGTELLGSQLRVEISKGRPRQGRRGSYIGGGGGDRGRRYDARRSGSGGSVFRSRGSSSGGRYQDRGYNSGGRPGNGGYSNGSSRDGGGSSGFSRRDVYGTSNGGRDGGRPFGSSSGYGSCGGGRNGSSTQGGGRFRSRSPANHRF